MAAFLRDWIVGVTCAAMAAAVLHAFLPKDGGVGRAGRLAAGLLLMLCAIGPLAGLDYDSLSQSLSQLRLSRSHYAQELDSLNDEILKELIESETEAYILDKAEGLGILCRASVTYALDGEGRPYPVGVHITGELTGEQERRLSEALEADLGVPVQNQTYTKGPGDNRDGANAP